MIYELTLLQIEVIHGRFKTIGARTSIAFAGKPLSKDPEDPLQYSSCE
jgi:hypothetical protein